MTADSNGRVWRVMPWVTKCTYVNRAGSVERYAEGVACSPSRTSRSAFGKCAVILAISAEACAKGGKSPPGESALPTRSRFFPLANKFGFAEERREREFAVERVTSSIQKCGSGLGTMRVSKFSP